MTLSKKISAVLTGCLIFLIALETGLNLVAPVYRWLNTGHAQTDKYTVLVLGESTSSDITTENGRSWVKQLGELLNSSGNSFEIINLAEPGMKTTLLLKKLSDYVQSSHPQLVISMMGVNDTPYFWYNELSLLQDDDRPFRLKTFQLLRVLLNYRNFAEANNRPSDIVEALRPLQRSALNHPAFEKLVNKLKSTERRSEGYKNILREIEEFLSAKSNSEKSQFYAELAFRTRAPIDGPEKNFSKTYEFIKRSIDNDANVGKSLDIAMTLARRMDIKSDCKGLMQKALDQNAIISGLSVARLMACVPEDKSFIESVLKKTNLPYTFIASDELPTIQNYKSTFRLLMNRNICWIAMGYPLQDFRETILQFGKTPEAGVNFFALENVTAFENALKSEGYDKLFTDRFGGTFGHFTEKAAKMVAQNAFNKIQSLKENHLCGL